MKVSELIAHFQGIVEDEPSASDWVVFIRVGPEDSLPTISQGNEPFWYEVGPIDGAEHDEPILISLGSFAQG